MYVKFLAIAIVAICALALAHTATAQQPSSHEGTVVSAGNGQLTMKGDDGKEHSHSVDASVQIIVNGQPGKLEDLKKGMRIRVTTDQDGKVMSISTVDERN